MMEAFIMHGAALQGGRQEGIGEAKYLKAKESKCF
jgi:hypothetical protein